MPRIYDFTLVLLLKVKLQILLNELKCTSSNRIYRLILCNAKSRTKETVNTLMLIIAIIMLLIITNAILPIFTTIVFHCQ